MFTFQAAVRESWKSALVFCLLKTRRPSEIRAFESVQPGSMSHRTKQETLIRLFVSAPQLLKSEHFQRVSAKREVCEVVSGG